MTSTTDLSVDTRSPIFVGGLDRTGVTVLRDMLNDHPRIAAGPETRFLETTSFSSFHQWMEETWMSRLDRYCFGSYEFDRALASFLDVFFARYQVVHGKQRWAEATPENIRYIDYLFRLFPHAQFIHVTRDPRDLYCLMKANMNRDALQPSHAEILQDWVRSAKQTAQWRTDVQRYREVRSEDLASQPATVMHAVLNFLAEPWSDGAAASWRSDLEQDGRASDFRTLRSSIGLWRTELTDRELSQIEAMCAPWLDRLGYRSATAAAQRD